LQSAAVMARARASAWAQLKFASHSVDL
jgi:hypothetical protein